ncbi:glycosyltransferase family 2 protein [Candidatus Pelagibacter sp.]|uniref:glycosyltransferase family 2 protein n=1 Tax=Candidatus Pelagibacter sp. TaxID=2024849 RepID=UPI003F828535
MRISILIATYNNIDYLKLFLHSIHQNSFFEHEILIHINDGSDGTLNYVKQKKLNFTYSEKNIGLCKSINLISKKATTDYILYAHDDMFFCKNWDVYLTDEIKNMKNNNYYLAGTNISVNKGLINYDCGSTYKDFNEDKFNLFCSTDKSKDYQSSHWSPHLIHKNLWEEVGGFSEEFTPGDGSDPDLCMKLWKKKVRIYRSLSKFKVYHFNSVTTRKSKMKLNDGTKTFILKYGFSPRFFRKYFLKGDISREYNGELYDPKINSQMIYDLIKNKLVYYYLKILNLLK